MLASSKKSLSNANQGLTIIEVVVAMFIMTVVGFGTLSGLLQSRKATEGSIYLATATTIAQGYIEQMKNMDFVLLDESTIPELINQGSGDSLVVSPVPANPEQGDPSTDVVNRRGIDINNTPSNMQDDLQIDFYVYIDDLTDEAAGVGEARRIILRYNYADTSNRAGTVHSNTLYAVRSGVPTF